jgi:hypothetical protein
LLNVYLRLKAFPAKVPVTAVMRPDDGKEPEYLVGMSAAASAIDANRTAPAAIAMALLDIFSPLARA